MDEQLSSIAGTWHCPLVTFEWGHATHCNRDTIPGKELIHVWLLLLMHLSLYQPDAAMYRDKIPCVHHLACGRGECWEGVCEPDGYCVAYWTCV